MKLMVLLKSYDFPLARVNVYVPNNYKETYRYSTLFINDGDFFDFEKMNLERLVVSLSPKDRSASYSPFPLDKSTSKLGAFAGEGKQYNQWLVDVLLPRLAKDFFVTKDLLIYGGVSLGGLETIYSLFFHDCFSSVFSICGSFWYPGFLGFVQKNKKVSSCPVFILNGSKEGVGPKKTVFSNAVGAAKEVAELMQAKIDFDPYGHHGHLEERLDFVLKEIDAFK